MSSRLVRPRRRGTPILSIFSVGLILAGLGLFLFELIAFTQREDLLPAGITMGGVAVGNLNDLDATAALEEAYSTPVTLYYQGSPINLTPQAIGFEISTPVMMASARAVGEAEGGFWGRFVDYLLGRDVLLEQGIDLVASYNRNALRLYLEDIASVYDRPAGTAEYDVSTLTISSGESGYQLDIEAAIPEIEAALFRADDRGVDLPIVGGDSATVSLDVLEDLIIAYLDSVGFIYDGQTSVASVFILDLTTGEEINLQGDVAYSAASTNKVGIMLDLFRQRDRELNQDEAFLLANSMLCSNNSSSNTIMSTFLGNGVGDERIFSGLASVTNTLQFLGASNTFLTAPFVEGASNQVFGSIAAPDTNPNPNFETYADSYNQTTAADMGTIFSMIYDCANYGSGLVAVYPDGEYTQHECRQMLELTSANNLNRLLQGGIPEGVRISHKNGWLPGRLAGARGATTGDAGIVFSPNGRNYVIAVYIWEDTDTTGFDRWPLIEE
ncbi:MAG: serine hydrolase, partial [Anaerolineae bacterium]|nr:serine hydrolase [Anaerolineae bacterium]